MIDKKRVVLVDHGIGGHHDSFRCFYKEQYQKKGYDVEVLIPKLSSRQKNRMIGKFWFYATVVLFYVKNHKNISKIHLLTYDRAIIESFLLILLSKSIVIANLHWYYLAKEGSIRCLLERILYKAVHKKLRILHHTHYGVGLLKTIGIKCEYIPYFTCQLIRLLDLNSNNEIVNTKMNLLFLGELRQEKGILDLLALIESKFFEDRSIELKIFGKNRLGVDLESYKQFKNVKIHDKVLSDEDYLDTLLSSDVILLPYRDHFFGQSGPLVEAVFLGKTIMLTDIPVFKEMGDLYGASQQFIFFKAADIIGLADNIQALHAQLQANSKFNSGRYELLKSLVLRELNLFNTVLE